MIDAVSENNIDEVLPLIRLYQKFYKVAEISDSKNKEFFSQFGESNPSGCQFIYRDNGLVVGFATVYFTYTSTITAKVAVLNDLYIISSARGGGVGRQLIEHCHKFSRSNGAVRLQWVTAPDNEPAQKLYDSMNINKSTWHFYAYNT